jgi:hypothetical protein
LLSFSWDYCSAEVEAESEPAQLKLHLKQPRKHPGRQEHPKGDDASENFRSNWGRADVTVAEKSPADLPRIEKIVACTPEQCVCEKLRKENRVIGYEKSEQLDNSRSRSSPINI